MLNYRSKMWIILVLSCAISTGLSQLTVTLPSGQVKGRESKTYDGKAYLSFQGIPLGEPPIGRLRFQPPQPAKRWSGVITLPKSTNQCYQMDSNNDRENEDCLYIYVYTPVLNAATNKTKLPVVFEIYGGGFRNGAVGVNPNYWVQNDVVVVSANYRIGAFGFLSTGNTVLPGNAGLKDQIIALEWTHNNIHLFGGDSSKITIKGASAGGASVGYLLLSPKAKGLFRAGIAESGSPLNTWTYLNNPMEYVVELSEKIQPTLSKNSTPAEYLAYLQSIPARSIDTAQAEVSTRPVVFVEPKHDGAFITESMYVSFEKGDYNKVPLILGVNSEERITIINSMSYVENRAKEADSNPKNSLPDTYYLKDDINATLAGKFIHDVYAGKNDHLVNHLGKYVRWESDNRFTRGVIKQGQLMSKYSPVYFYQFSYKGPTNGYNKTIAEADTVGHGEELGFFSHDHHTMTKEDVLTQNRLLNMWLTFVKELNPTPHKLELLENIIWPKVSPSNYEYLNINHTLTIEKQPKGEYFLGWQSLFGNYMKQPFTTY